MTTCCNIYICVADILTKTLNTKIEYIERLLLKHELDPFRRHLYLAHAVFNTIEVSDLIKIYIETSNLKLKNTLDNHLKNRFNEANLNCKKLFNHLMQRTKKANYNKRQRIRVLLSYLLTHLSKSYTQKYFDFFSISKFYWDIAAALKVSNVVWNLTCDNIFLDKYLETGIEGYLIALINNAHSDFIAQRLNEFWEEDYPASYLKNKIIRKIAKKHFDTLSFLKGTEPDKFLYASAFSHVKFSSSDLKSIYDTLNKEQKEFGLWCIGKINNWELLSEELKKYIC